MQVLEVLPDLLRAFSNDGFWRLGPRVVVELETIGNAVERAQ